MTRKSNRARIIYVIVAIVIIGVTGWFLTNYYLNWAKTPYISTNISGKFKVNDKKTVPIIIDTKGQAINAVEVYLTYHAEELKVESVTKDQSFFSLWIPNEPKFSNETGEISFAGGLPRPGFSGVGTIGTVIINAQKKGTFYLTFNSKTRALLNDGKGTAISLRLDPIKIEAQ